MGLKTKATLTGAATGAATGALTATAFKYANRMAFGRDGMPDHIRYPMHMGLGAAMSGYEGYKAAKEYLKKIKPKNN